MGHSAHAVPKKFGFTVVENENKELVQTQLPTKIWVCIDYRKLNAATRKDHFSLPFIDQMLERLAGQSITVSWTVTRGIIRFLLLLRTKKRLRSHVHLGHLLIVECLWLVQCPSNILTLHVESFLWYARTILRDLYGWFLHLRRFIHSMSPPFRTHPPTLYWEKSDTELGEMPLHGKTWNCLGSWNLQERNWSG